MGILKIKPSHTKPGIVNVVIVIISSHSFMCLRSISSVLFHFKLQVEEKNTIFANAGLLATPSSSFKPSKQPNKSKHDFDVGSVKLCHL